MITIKVTFKLLFSVWKWGVAGQGSMELTGYRCPSVFGWTSKVGCGREDRAVQGQGPGVEGWTGLHSSSHWVHRLTGNIRHLTKENWGLWMSQEIWEDIVCHQVHSRQLSSRFTIWERQIRGLGAWSQSIVPSFSTCVSPSHLHHKSHHSSSDYCSSKDNQNSNDYRVGDSGWRRLPLD